MSVTLKSGYSWSGHNDSFEISRSNNASIMGLFIHYLKPIIISTYILYLDFLIKTILDIDIYDGGLDFVWRIVVLLFMARLINNKTSEFSSNPDEVFRMFN